MPGPSTELRSAFTFELSTASRKMRKLFDGFVRERGLTLSRARALLLLSRHRPWNQTELADALDIEHPSVVRLLDGLEKQGLIARSAVEGNRRTKQIELQEPAKAQVQELEEITERIRALLLRGIDDGHLAIALGVLRQITRNAERAAADRGAKDHHADDR